MEIISLALSIIAIGASAFTAYFVFKLNGPRIRIELAIENSEIFPLWSASMAQSFPKSDLVLSDWPDEGLVVVVRNVGRHATSITQIVMDYQDQLSVACTVPARDRDPSLPHRLEGQGIEEFFIGADQVKLFLTNVRNVQRVSGTVGAEALIRVQVELSNGTTAYSDQFKIRLQDSSSR